MIEYLRHGFVYGWHDFRAWIFDVRTICVFLCVFVFVHENLSGAAAFADLYGLKFTPWILPFMASTRIVDLVLWLALLLLLCDLGTEKKVDLYVRLRLPLWAIRVGRIFSAFLRVFTFWMIVAASPLILFFNHIEWSIRWGKVIGTLARDASDDVIGTYSVRFSSTIVNRYSPLGATFLCFLLSVLAGWVLAVIFLIGNEIYNKMLVGSFFVGFFVLLDFWVRTDPLACRRWIAFSFVSFHNLRCINRIPKTGYVTPIWAVVFCLAVVLVLSIVYIFGHSFEAKYDYRKKFEQVIWRDKGS